MLMRGEPQRRQSEGNNVANRPAAMPLTHETDGIGCATTLVPAARIGVPILLLKTILPHPAAATGAPTGRISFSIAALEAGRNAGEEGGSYTRSRLPRKRALSVAHLTYQSILEPGSCHVRTRRDVQRTCKTGAARANVRRLTFM